MFLSKMLTLKPLAKMTNMTSKHATSKRHNRRPDNMQESRIIPLCVRRHVLAPVGFMEIPVGYAVKDLSALVKIAENLFLHPSHGFSRFFPGIEILILPTSIIRNGADVPLEYPPFSDLRNISIGHLF